jgi:DNA gyrase subunit A
MRQYLLVITEDGYGKRVAVDEIRRTRRNPQGVKLSAVPVAFAEVVNDTNAELILASANGKIQRLRVGDIPTRRRTANDRHRRYPPKGVRVMRLDPGDRVAAGAVVSIPGVDPVAAPAAFPAD